MYAINLEDVSVQFETKLAVSIQLGEIKQCIMYYCVRFKFQLIQRVLCSLQSSRLLCNYF